MHRSPLSPLLLTALALALLLGMPAWTAPGQPATKPPPNQTAEYPASGLKIGSDVIRPGEVLPMVFGIVGPPDQVRAMRSKKEADDYVMFSYFAQGFSLDINQKNHVQGILVESRGVEVSGVPFHVGDTKQDVLKAWGDPDRTQSKVLAYWRRGVYVSCDESDKVTSLFLTAPGQVEKPADGRAPVGG
ncbi:MAG: hypothetical protein ACOX9B_08865 [Candidatus Xenobium sp.]|nr:hypothetical protein [Burkholderiales bacterium]